MDDRESLKNSKVAEVFQTMSYGENFDDLSKVTEWFRTKDKIFTYVEKSNEPVSGIPKELKNVITDETLCTIYIPEIDVIKRILSKSNEKIKWSDTPAFERTKLLYRLAVEIERNFDLLAQIETVTRGILAKDTKGKVLPLLAQYFYFYSGFSVQYNEENPNYKSSGTSVAVISNENALSNIGLFLAPALAAGNNIILQIGTKLIPSALFIFELAQKVGIPQDVLKVIPSDDGELLPYFSCDNVSTVTLFVDINNEKYRGINNLNKKILTLASYKTPIIVFDNADLDSACENVIDSVWSYNGLYLGSADTILIQENIFDSFLNKLKTKLQSLKISSAHDKLADISNAFENSSLIKLAKNQGLEVFEADNSTNSPVLVIGGRIHSKIPAKHSEANVATVLTFRTIDEAVNLANNTKQGLGASVWSENVGVINEVTRKLRVSNVWINSICVAASDVTYSPMKSSGVGYFGGAAGFYEYVQVKNVNSNVQVEAESVAVNDSIIAIINKAKKAQENWHTLSKINKNKIFQQFAEYIYSNKKQLSGGLDEKSLNLWISELYRWITTPSDAINTSLNSGYSLSTFSEPRGVLAIELDNDTNISNIALLLSAVSQGNAILLIDNGIPAQLYTEFSKMLPSGVLNIIPYNLSNIKTISTHQDVSTYFGSSPTNPIFSFLPIQDSQKFTFVEDTLIKRVGKATIFVKNIWSDIGKSSNCNLGSY